MKKAKEKLTKNKGFTLVELIIVIAIMAILAGAISPLVIRYIQKARVARATDEARVILNAVESAIASNAGADATLNTNRTFTNSDGNDVACGMVTNWILGQTQSGTEFTEDDADYADYICAKEVLANLQSESTDNYKFFKFNGSATRPIGMNCATFYATYECPGVIVLYNTQGKVIFLEYYNYSSLIRYENGEFIHMESDTFVDSDRIR